LRLTVQYPWQTIEYPRGPAIFPQASLCTGTGPAPRVLPCQWRQQCLAPWRKVLIDGVQHEAYPEVFAHDRHDLDRMLTPEMAHHLFPKFTADPVFAKQHAPESDQRRVLVGQLRHVPVVLDDINNRLLQALPQTRQLMRGPFVLLVDLPRGNQDRELKISRTDGALLTCRDTQVALPRAVDRNVRRSRPWGEVGPRVQKTLPLFVQVLRSDRGQPRERHRMDIRWQRVLGLGDHRKRSKQQDGQSDTHKVTPSGMTTSEIQRPRMLRRSQEQNGSHIILAATSPRTARSP